MKLYITVSGSGDVVDVCEVSDLDEALAKVKECDETFEHWNGRSPVPECIEFWEGCDVYVEDGDCIWGLIDDQWELL